ncbi:MAG: hypothetical protein ACKV2O_17300 [Acidimicrobiales bacterium]
MSTARTDWSTTRVLTLRVLTLRVLTLRLVAGLLVIAAVGALAGCTDENGDGAAASTSLGAESTLVTLGPPVTGPPATYIVPDISEASAAEICAGTKEVVSVDDEISALLGPILASDSSEAADAALLQALSGIKPLIDRASSGYDRMAAVLPAELAADAKALRDATLTFYGAVSASQSMDGLAATVSQARQFTSAATEAAARLDATTKKVCNQSLYNS